MKTRILVSITAITLFALLEIPVQLPAQEQQEQDHDQKQTSYKLVDLGTFGGPSAGTAGTAFHSPNNQGVATGGADTSIPDPNPSHCFADCFVNHTFQWQNGVLTDLGALSGVNNSSYPNDINVDGVIAGELQNGTIDPVTGITEFDAVVWRNGQIINLGTFGGNFSLANAINNRGQVAGFALNTTPDSFSLGDPLCGFGLLGTQMRAFIWQHGVLQDLGTLGGPDSCALWINEKGQAAGHSFTNSTPNSANDSCGTNVPTEEPFIWEKGKGMTGLGTLGGTCGLAHWINNRGQVVGLSDLAGDSTAHPFLWDKGVLTDLGTLGGSFGEALFVSDAGEILGWAFNQNDKKLLAFVWRHGVMTNLGALGDDNCSKANVISRSGQIVGVSTPCGVGPEHAVLWQHGHIIDLNAFVPPGSALTLSDATSVNDRGEIAVNAVLSNGDHRIVLLIPCDGDNADGDNADGENCQHGDEGGAAVTQTHLAPVGQTSAAAAPGKLTPETLAGIRARLGRRFPYRGLAPVQAPPK